MPILLPGTVIPYSESAGRNTYALIAPIILATGGISLSQLSAITGLEGSTIQNWVKRGWVAPSREKKYGEQSLVRVLLINILRSTMKLESIARLMKYVNGEVTDTSDDIMHDTQLYNLLCELIYEVEKRRLQTADEIRCAIEEKIPDDISGRERKVLSDVLLIMVQSAMAGYYRSAVECEYEELGITEG